MEPGDDVRRDTAFVDLAVAFGRATTSDLEQGAPSYLARTFAETVGRYLEESDEAWEGELRRFCTRFAYQIGERAQELAGEESISETHLETVIPRVFERAKGVVDRAGEAIERLRVICCPL